MEKNKRECLYVSKYDSPLGKCFLVSNESALLGLWLDAYFAGKNPDRSEIQLAPQGSIFQQLVWKHLCQIPYGETITYGEIADKVAKDLGKDGRLTGYAGGIDKKMKLLELEK